MGARYEASSPWAVTLLTMITRTTVRSSFRFDGVASLLATTASQLSESLHGDAATSIDKVCQTRTRHQSIVLQWDLCKFSYVQGEAEQAG